MSDIRTRSEIRELQSKVNNLQVALLRASDLLDRIVKQHEEDIAPAFKHMEKRILDLELNASAKQ